MGCASAKDAVAGTGAPVDRPEEEPAAPEEEPAEADENPKSVVPLKVAFVSAKGLRDADYSGKSEPYVICQVPDKPNSKIQSKVVQSKLDPEWNEDPVKMPEYVVGDSLRFQVKDNVDSDDMLGCFVMEPGMFWDKGFDGEVELTGTGKEGKASLKVKIECKQPVVWVTVVSASGLRNADMVGKSDPYCLVEVPGREGARFKTTCLHDDLNPQWNYQEKLDDYHWDDPIQITVLDSDRYKGHDVLGSVKILPDKFMIKSNMPGTCAVEEWELDLELENTKQTGKSSLKLKIKTEIKEEEGNMPLETGCSEHRARTPDQPMCGWWSCRGD